jgi:DNA-directed RNA polymerase
MRTYEEQLQREENTDLEAVRDTLRKYADAALSGNVDGLPRTKILLGRIFSTVRDELAEQVNASNRALAKKWYTEVDPGVATVAAIRVTTQIIQSKMTRAEPQPVTVQVLTSTIGRTIVQEALIARASKASPVYVERAIANLRASNTHSENHTRRTLRTVCENVLQLERGYSLSNAELMHIGKVALDACMSAGLVEVHYGKGKKGSMTYYTFTPEVEEFLIPSRYDVKYVTDKAHLSMLAPPEPWTATDTGGYYSARRKLVYPLLSTSWGRVRKTCREAYKEALKYEHMPVVFEAANYLQAQPFEIRTEVYDSIKKLWDEGGGVLDIPVKDIGEPPEFPLGTAWDKANATAEEQETFYHWKAAMRAYHTKRAKNTSRLRECGTFLKTALTLQGESLYHPVYADFRSRLYYRGLPNPQGSDVAKAVLHFKTKKPLGDRGLFWLYVHVANSLGYDSVPFQDRVNYVLENWEELQGYAYNPADSDLYRAADSPFCAVAAVLEIIKAVESGNPVTYETGLIVHMDATCSGLQHFSAALRDPVGGACVNLVPLARKADIYTAVAEHITRKLQGYVLGGTDQATLAGLWLDIGIDRKIAKKPVMTYVYSATFRGIADEIMTFLHELGWRKEGHSISAMASFMTKELFSAIECIVPAAAEAMRWLRSLIKDCPRDQPMQFRTPTGFLVNHDYREVEESRIKLLSCGVQYVVAYNDKDTVKRTRMQNAMAPNFVHSLDASHLMFTVCEAKRLGMSIVTIHDSYGTHPGDVDDLLHITKAAFITMYTDNNVFKNLIDDLGLDKPLPSTGTLGLNLIQKSSFFFC